LSFVNEKDGERRGRSSHSTEQGTSQISTQKKKRDKAPNVEVGHALRSVYQRTIDEDIPMEMLDLLGKLG